MSRANRVPSRWALPVVALVLVASGWTFLGHAFAVAPALAALSPSTVTLTAPVEHVTPGQRAGRGPYAIFRWSGASATLENLCFLSGCGMPPRLAQLRAGDRVTLWTKAGAVWQVEKDGATLLPYEDVRGAFGRAMHRRVLVEAPLWLSAVGLLAVLLLRRRRAAPEGGAPQSDGGAVRVRFRVRVNGKTVVGGEDEEAPKRLS